MTVGSATAKLRIFPEKLDWVGEFDILNCDCKSVPKTPSLNIMVRESFLPFALPDIDHTEHAQVQEVLNSGWLTTGLKVKQFQSAFGSAVGSAHALAVNSATAAMHLALEAIGIQPGDEVIVPTYTFAATAEVVRYFDAKPVFVDVGADCLNLRPELVEAAITPQTRAILPVHFAGLPVDLPAIFDIAQRFGLAVIEDAAHAFPSLCQGRVIGMPPQGRSSIRHAVAYSFYATKTITTGEGGMLCSDDASLIDRARVMALHGISRDAWNRYSAEGSWYYEVVAPGFKYNMTDLAAALGLAQLSKAVVMRERRAAIAQQYSAAFRSIAELQVPVDRIGDQHAWHLYVLRLNLQHLSIGRDAFISALRQRNIGTSVHFIPLHLHPYYRQSYGYLPQDFPVATQEYGRAISLPIYSKMTDTDVADVIEAVVDIVKQYSLKSGFLQPSVAATRCNSCNCCYSS